MINRSTTRENPHIPVALDKVAVLFGTLVAETILASVHVRAHKQAGHMDASDLIKVLQNTLRGGGRPHMEYGPAEILPPVGAISKHVRVSADLVATRARAHPRGKPGFSTFEGGCGRETDSLLEGTGFEPSVPRERDYAFRERLCSRDRFTPDLIA